MTIDPSWYSVLVVLAPDLTAAEWGMRIGCSEVEARSMARRCGSRTKDDRMTTRRQIEEAISYGIECRRVR